MKNEIELTNTQHLSSDLQILAQLASDYAKSAKSQNTKKAYRSDWVDFEFWCNQKKVNSLPASPEVVATYLADRATNPWIDINGDQRDPLKTSTLQRRLISISFAHKIANATFDKKNPIITETWKGIQNIIGTAQTRKDPILLETLKNMIGNISQDKKNLNKSIRDKAILLIGFSGGFRRSEIVSLNVEDLKWQREGVLVTLRKSKTDQIGKGREIGIPFGSNPLTCPVRALEDWLNNSGISSGAIFRPINRHGHIQEIRLSSHAVALIIKENLCLMENIKNYSGHSLRSGFVTTAAIANVPEYLIMRQTGHKKSDTIKKYIREGTVWQENASYRLGL